MQALYKLFDYIQNLEHKKFQRYMLIALLGIALLVGGIMYFIYDKKSDLINQIKQLNALSTKALTVIDDNRKMAQDEMRFQEIIARNKEFTIKGFFEQFCKDQDITPEAGWGDVSSEAISDKLDEIVLKATFKNQTTEKLIQILNVLDQKEILYIKELVIKTEAPGKITFDLTLATKKYKSIIE